MLHSLQRKIIIEKDNLLEHPDDIKSRQRLRGLVSAARQVKKNAFPSIRSFAFNNYDTDLSDK